VALTLDPEEVQDEATRAEFPEVAGWLQDHLGQQLTAYMAGLRDPKVVGQWRREKSEPRGAAEMRLRCAYQAARLIVDAYGERTTKAWLLGTNTRLDDEAPAWLLRRAEEPDHIRFIVPAARAFAGGSD